MFRPPPTVTNPLPRPEWFTRDFVINVVKTRATVRIFRWPEDQETLPEYRVVSRLGGYIDLPRSDSPEDDRSRVVERLKFLGRAAEDAVFNNVKHDHFDVSPEYEYVIIFADVGFVENPTSRRYAVNGALAMLTVDRDADSG